MCVLVHVYAVMQYVKTRGSRLGICLDRSPPFSDSLYLNVELTNPVC